MVCMHAYAPANTCTHKYTHTHTHTRRTSDVFFSFQILILWHCDTPPPVEFHWPVPRHVNVVYKFIKVFTQLVVILFNPALLFICFVYALIIHIRVMVISISVD